jgi:hypothetical protein
MNKVKAKNEAKNNSKTWGELLDLVKAARGTGGMAKINKSITKEQALDIFENMINACNLTDIPKGVTVNYKQKEIMTGHGLGIMNLLRECG